MEPDNEHVSAAVSVLRQEGFEPVTHGSPPDVWAQLAFEQPFTQIACLVRNHADLCDEATRAFVLLEGLDRGRWTVDAFYSTEYEVAVITASAAV